MKLKSSLLYAFVTGIGILFILPAGGCKKEGENKENHVPRAAYSLNPSRGDVSTLIEFDAGMVSDHEDPVTSLEVRWDWNNDDIFDTPYTTVKEITHRYDEIGVYFPMLEVRDLKGMTDTIKKMVVIVSDLSNMPPEGLDLLSPPNWQTWMDDTITFKWICTDPENDPLVFDIWIGRSMNSLQLVRNGITDFNLVDGIPQYETTISGFSFNQDYFWQIGAKDPSGNYSVSIIYKFTTRPANSG